MPTFQVPQFIEQKSKIVGPLTLKQFLWIAAAAALSVFSYYTFTLFLWALISIIAGLVAVALAFIKIQGRDLPTVLWAALWYVWKPKTYTWKREAPRAEVLDTSSLERLQALRRKAELQEKIGSLKTFILTKASRSRHHIRGEQKREEYQTVRYLTGEEEKARKVDYQA